MARSFALPATRLIAGNSGRSLAFIRLACKPPLSRCVHLGSKCLKSRLPGKMASFGSRWRHLCRMSSPDLTSQLEFGKKNNDKRVNGIFWILLLNLGVYAADHWLLLREIKALYLYHARPTWFQFITATFCHASWNHLSSNLFFLYIFGELFNSIFQLWVYSPLASPIGSCTMLGKLVEEEEGSFGLWASYILTGAGANIVSWLVLPRNAVSVGASGAVFGLFAISVLVKIRWDWRKILEVLILGQFVIQRVMEAAQASAALSGTGFALQNVNHIAHLSGALIGVSLIWLLNSIPLSNEETSSSIKKNER